MARCKLRIAKAEAALLDEASSQQGVHGLFDMQRYHVAIARAVWATHEVKVLFDVAAVTLHLFGGVRETDAKAVEL